MTELWLKLNRILLSKLILVMEKKRKKNKVNNNKSTFCWNTIMRVMILYFMFGHCFNLLSWRSIASHHIQTHKNLSSYFLLLLLWSKTTHGYIDLSLGNCYFSFPSTPHVQTQATIFGLWLPGSRFMVHLSSAGSHTHFFLCFCSGLQKLQQELEFLEVQEEYIKDEQKNLKKEFLHAQEEVKRIQSIPLVIGQFLEAVDQNTAIVGSTTGTTEGKMTCTDCQIWFQVMLIWRASCVWPHFQSQCV